MNQSFLFFRLLFLFLSSILTSLVSYGQAGDTIKPLPQINKEFLVVAHIVADQQGNIGSISPASITATMNQVSQIFAPIGATFTICKFDTIYNFQYNAIDNSIQRELDPQYKVSNRINIYYIQDFIKDLADACGNASLGGILFTGGDIAIKKDCNNAGTVAHEMGHYFSLPHTFQGSGTENADGSNCKDEGDKICDTPADPFIKGAQITDYIDANCKFINQRLDANGDYYDPDVSNIMSYYIPCVCLKFTHQQYEKMANYYLSNPTAW